MLTSVIAPAVLVLRPPLVTASGSVLPSSMMKKRNQNKQLGCSNGRTINLPDRQVVSGHPITLCRKVDGELITGTFSRNAAGWRAALEFARGDSEFMETMSSVDSAKAAGFTKWFIRFAISEGLIPQDSCPQNGCLQSQHLKPLAAHLST